MKRTMITLLATLCVVASAAGRSRENADSLLLVFWNVENFFSHRSPGKPQGLNYKRFTAKCAGISKTIFKLAETKGGRLPDIIGLAEVESDTVLWRLLDNTLLRKAGYRIVHYDSHDPRGIDCALLYRPQSVRLLRSSPRHLRDSSGAILATRDILLAEFDKLSVLVNHHPSQIGGKSERRKIAMARMTEVVDSLASEGHERILCVGDFNEDLWTSEGTEGRVFPGTIKYNGKWEKIDGHLAFGSLEVREEIFTDPMLWEKDKAFGGLKPRRSFIGPRYNGGISDHLPIVLTARLL